VRQEELQEEDNQSALLQRISCWEWSHPGDNMLWLPTRIPNPLVPASCMDPDCMLCSMGCSRFCLRGLHPQTHMYVTVLADKTWTVSVLAPGHLRGGEVQRRFCRAVFHALHFQVVARSWLATVSCQVVG
jgi:hypothetical protein